MKCCPSCGQTLPRKLPIVPEARGIKRRLLDIVHRAGPNGISTDDLFDMIWGNSSDGGPETGTKTLHVHVSVLNKALLKHKLKIKNTDVGRGACGSYKLVELTTCK